MWENAYCYLQESEKAQTKVLHWPHEVVKTQWLFLAVDQGTKDPRFVRMPLPWTSQTTLCEK